MLKRDGAVNPAGDEQERAFLNRPGHHHTHLGAAEQGDDSLCTSERGIRTLQLSLALLALTALLQLLVVALSGSIALLADTIHNFGDAATSVPLWVAFALARRERSRRFTYGYGRAEDVAGTAIVVVILCSAAIVGYEAITRLFNPQPVAHLWLVAAVAIIGFLGNEAVAVYRIRVGREIGSAALVADGQHARIDGLASLAVLPGAAGAALGLPILDPLVGLAITVLILLIAKDAALAIWHRLLDGIEPELLAAMEHAPLHVPGVIEVHEVRGRWLGHRLHADLHITVNAELSVNQAHDIAEHVNAALARHLPAFGGAQIHVCPPAEQRRT